MSATSEPNLPGWAKFVIGLLVSIVTFAAGYGALDARVGAIEKHETSMVTNDRFEALERRVDVNSQRLDRADKRVDAIDRNVVRICVKLGAGCVDRGGE